MDDRPTLLLPPHVTVGEPTGPPPAEPPEQRPTSGNGFRHLALVAVIALLAGAIAGMLGGRLTAPAAEPAGDREPPLTIPANDGLDVPAIVDAVGPSVVSIQTELAGPFGRPGTGAGTGIILDSSGEILTNAHVVDGATTIRVTVAGEARSREANLVGSDPANDLALLRVDDATGLPAATLGSIDDVRVGEDVVAIGNSLGLRGGPSVTRGIISGLGRTIDTRGGAMTGLVQTDASISSGNSGGPLVNAAGAVIGVNTAVATSGGGRAVENIGFAIPIDQAMVVVERLRTGGDAVTPQGYLGVAIADPTDGSRGAVVTSVEPSSPAARAGLRPRDLVVAVDDGRVDGAAAFAAAIRGDEPGSDIELTVVRGDEELELVATLGTRPND